METFVRSFVLILTGFFKTKHTELNNVVRNSSKSHEEGSLTIFRTGIHEWKLYAQRFLHSFAQETLFLFV